MGVGGRGGQDSAPAWLRWVLTLVLISVALCSIVAIAGLILGGSYLLSRDHGLEETRVEADAVLDPTATKSPLPTLPSSLSGVAFPTQPIEFPPDWPDDLHFPGEFTLVETTSGTLEGGVAGQGAKLLFEGASEEASELIISSLEANDWHMVENVQLDSGGLVLAFEGIDRQASLLIVLEGDEHQSGIVRVVVTVFR